MITTCEHCGFARECVATRPGLNKRFLCEECKTHDEKGKRVRFGLEHFGQRLRHTRESRGWSQCSLASKMDVDPSWVSHFECGRRLPSLELLEQICIALEVSADSLMGLSK